MALIDNVISIDYGQGLDTKTDPKMVVGGKLLQLQDGIFTNAKRITKRNGYDNMTNAIVGGGTWSNPTMTASYRNELLLAATASNGQRLFSYSSNLSAWIDKGKYSSVDLSRLNLGSNSNQYNNSTRTLGTVNPSVAIAGNVALFAYDSGSAQTYITAVDLSTDTTIASNVLVPGSSIGDTSKAVLLGSSTLGVLVKSSGGGLSLLVVTVSAAGVSFGSPVTITGSAWGAYDAVTVSSGLAVVYSQSSGTLEMLILSTSGSTLYSASVSGVGEVNPLTLAVDSSGNIWCAWGFQIVSNPIQYLVMSSTLTSVLGVTNLISNASNAFLVSQVTMTPESSTVMTFYYSLLTTGGVSGSYTIMPVIYSGTGSVTGTVVAPTVWLNNANIYSRPLSVNGTIYIAVVFYSSYQPTGFIVDTSDISAVAKFAVNEAEGAYFNGDNYATRNPSFINSLIAISSTKVAFCGGVISTSAIVTQSSGIASGLSSVTLGYALFTFDFSGSDAYQSIVQQDQLSLNGAIVSCYDSGAVTELGFNLYPDGVSATISSSSSGNITAGTYLYYVVYEWLDALGNLHQSAPSVAFSITTSTSTNTIQITVQDLWLTKKPGISIALYRTKNAGTIAYRLGPSLVTQIINQASGGTTEVFTDDASDSSLNTQDTLYTEGGSVLENLAPPPAMVMWVNNNRMWVVDSENPETTIEYSKTAAQGYGISFSTGQLELVIDSKYGVITGASPMDEKTIILKENGVGYFIGDGANDAGTGSSITNFQFIPSDVGCEASKSVILFPDGILFQASNNRGIYLLSRGISVQYFGFPVEKYNSQDVTSALIVPNKNQIRFLTSSGSSLLYDYIFNQWSVFTNHAGLSACAFGGLYVYVRADGSIYKENETSFLDDTTSYALTLQTAWLALSSVQNFERVRWCLSLGDYENGSSASHGIQIQEAYDFSTTFGTAAPYYFGQASTSGTFQYRNFFSQQKVDSLTLLISEIVSGASGEYIDLSNLSLVAALKRSSQKVPASQSVGAA